MNLSVEFTDDKVRHTGLSYKSAGACGLDLYAARNPDTDDGSWVVPARREVTIPCGIKVVIPEGHDGEVAMRSGHRFNRGLSCFDGKIDSDYRGEIMVLVENHRSGIERIAWGERFAQLIIRPHARVTIERVADVWDVSPTERGEKGFGSSGQ